MPHQAKLELLSFGNLLCTDFDPLNIATTLQVKTIDKLKQEVSAEGHRIINEFKNAPCRNLEEIHLERYIQSHQREAINLMDTTGKHMESLEKELIEPDTYHQAISLYQCIITTLENMLNHIEKEQSKYFDLSIFVPYTYRIESAELLNRNLNVLKAKLKSKSIDTALQQTILDYITHHCARESCSYQQLNYAKLMMDNMLNLLSENKDIDWTEKAMVNLIYLNFNTESFHDYCKHYIASKVGTELTFAAQVEKFSWYAKEIKNIYLKPNVACEKDNLPISESILTYISLELVHITTIQSPPFEKQPAVDLTERADKLDFKLPFKLTVAQLALFIELFIRLRFISIEKGKMMTTLDFIAQNATTIGTDSISTLSLNKSRKPDTRTIDWMIETLQAMIKVLEEMTLE
ncbi:hypothetical protein [Pedobacter nyackensis]|uniref:Uncharacterized protein n=1 Tax=Pedobacter nyackensis TaxID=475255 RepID=A0A1W2EZI7_9SPHI|nr:hypothetical protein [Pedobacter nyackensis]SMD15081.1 hypothetical protein SAMN04488101_11812 [Pedobacter nyackensis]